jgi:hypothetical protein
MHCIVRIATDTGLHPNDMKREKGLYLSVMEASYSYPEGTNEGLKTNTSLILIFSGPKKALPV